MRVESNSTFDLYAASFPLMIEISVNDGDDLSVLYIYRYGWRCTTTISRIFSGYSGRAQHHPNDRRLKIHQTQQQLDKDFFLLGTMMRKMVTKLLLLPLLLLSNYIFTFTSTSTFYYDSYSSKPSFIKFKGCLVSWHHHIIIIIIISYHVIY